jgi:hypothetical protein
MIKEDHQKLREAAALAQSGVNSNQHDRDMPSRLGAPWGLQTSNSFRRIGQYGDGDVLCATKQRSDGHPDLIAPPGVLEYIVAAQPDVVLALLDHIEVLEHASQLTGINHEMFEETLRLLGKQNSALREQIKTLTADLELAKRAAD